MRTFFGCSLCEFSGTLPFGSQNMCVSLWLPKANSSAEFQSNRHPAPQNFRAPQFDRISADRFGFLGGVRADRALDAQLGPEPRIGLDFNPAPAPSASVGPPWPQKKELGRGNLGCLGVSFWVGGTVKWRHFGTRTHP